MVEEQNNDWEYPLDAVLLRKSDSTIWHVYGRFESADDDDRYYQLWDATHTTRQWAPADDVEGWNDDADGEYAALRLDPPAEMLKPVELDIVRHLRDN